MRTLLLAAVFAGSTALAATSTPQQATTPTPAPAPAAATTAPPRGQTPAPGAQSQNRALSQFRNVRLDITITDTVGSGGPTKKAATLLLMHGRNGQVRSTGIRGGIINVDAVPSELADGRVMVSFTLEYMPVAEDAPPQQQVGKLTESLTVILENGKPMVVTQSADPQSDRKVTVELTATLMK
jgi:hypothetical protein